MFELVPLTSLRRNQQAALRIEQLAIWLGAVKEDGFPPILISDENEVLLGESRVAVAQASGLDGISAIRLSRLDEQQQRKFVLRERLLAVKHLGSSTGLHVELSQLALKFPQLREAIAHPDDAGLKAHLLLQSLGINDFGAGATTETTARPMAARPAESR